MSLSSGKRQRRRSACEECRRQKIRYDKVFPQCMSCNTKGYKCVYKRRSTRHKVRNMVTSGQENSTQPVPTASGAIRWTAPADVLLPTVSQLGKKNRAWEPVFRDIQITECLSAFHGCISPLCPLLRPDELTLGNILALLHGKQPAEKAVALAVWALGDWCLNARSGPSTAARKLRVKETDARCGEAADLLEGDTAKGLHRTRAYILLACYRGLCGDLHGFCCYLGKATGLLKRDPPRESLSGAVTSKENSLRVASWICAGMERYASCCHIAEFSQRLCSTRHIPLATEYGLEDGAGATLLSAVWVLKAECTASAYSRFHNAESEEVMFSDKAAEEHEKLFPPPLNALLDFGTPSSDLATALVQAARWNAIAAIYMPLIHRFCDELLHFGSWHLEESEGARRGVRALIGSLRAFHLVSGEAMVMPNVATIAYLQVRNLLLIKGCRTESWLWPCLETDWEELLLRTTSFLEAMLKGPSVLTVEC